MSGLTRRSCARLPAGTRTPARAALLEDPWIKQAIAILEARPPQDEQRAKLLGHSSVATTQVYTLPSEAEERAAVEKLAGRRP
jgi:integrase